MSAHAKKPVVLVVDDEKSTRDGLKMALQDAYEVRVAENGERALQQLEPADVDLLLTDLRMPGMDGMTLMQKAMARVPGLACIVLTAYGSIEMAVEAVKKGAKDFLTKPFNLEHMELVLERTLRSRAMDLENRRLRQQLDEKYGMENIVGSAPPMLRVFEVIRQAAPSQATVLIQGESGTGKELVAQAIHRYSLRKQGPFVPIHCAALSTPLLESELFGHEKGAFTGALARRRGRFELADGGSLFLDEVSEIDPAVQVKLLRVLEERTFERVGGNDAVATDIRLIAATNKDLKEQVAQGAFREDLFFRLDVVGVTLPPLRERADDIPLLCSHFLKEFCARNRKSIEGMTPEALHMLGAYPWPGNVRELRNVIEKMVVLTTASRLTARDVPRHIREAAGGRATPPGGASAEASLVENGGALAESERRQILAVLRKHDDNRTAAARELGISRRTLHRKLRAYEEGASGG